MNTKTLKHLYLGVCGSLLLGFAIPAQAVLLELTPADTIAATGDSVTLDLVISGLGNFGPDSLGDFDIDIGFDSSRLSLGGFTLGNFLGDIGLGDAFDFSLGDLGGGIVNLSVVSFLEPDGVNCFFCIGPFLDDIQPDSFSLATLMFDIIDLEAGNATVVSIDNILALGDGFGEPLTIDGVNNATIRNPGAMQVPEPGTLALFGLGLLALGWRRRSDLRR